jgi:DNA-binding CsgD family transcriptional regulator
MACPKCGRENRADAAFCDGCGASLAEPVVEAPDAVGPAGLDRSVFIGREPELAALRAALEKAVAGQGRVLALAGEPGIGKTRTAQVLAADAAARGVAVYWGRCHEEPGSPPYWPWLQVIRTYIDEHDDARLRATFGPAASELAEFVPQLGLRLPFVPVIPPIIDAAQARFRLFDAVLGGWKRAAAHEPLLLLLDNVHWADTPSLRLLEFLAPEIASSRLLVLVTYRDIELSRRHPLSDSLGELAKQPTFQRVRLRGLSASETARFVAAATGNALAGDLLATIHSQTEGNPLFVAEMARYLVEEGLLGATPREPQPRTRRPGRVHRIPEGIKEAIGTRLNRLSPACNEMLTNAAVIGRVFQLNLLARLSDPVPAGEQEVALEEGLAASVIEELADPGAYQFSHALIREALYDEIPATRRALLHLRIGTVLEAIAGSGAMPDLAALAHHYCSALPGGDPAKAIAYAQRAAARADELFAYEEAARYYRLAIQALDARQTPDPQQRLRLLIALGEAHTRGGGYTQAAEILAQAAGSAKALGVSHELARAACSFEAATWRPGLPGDAAAGLLREALAALGDGDTIATAQVLSSLSRALELCGEPKEANRVNEQAVAMARRLGDAATLASALRAGLSARWVPERLPTRIASTLEAMQLARQGGDRECWLEAASWRLFDLMQIGEFQARIEEFEDYTREADEVRQPFYQYIGLSSRSMLALFCGRIGEAERWAERAFEFGGRMPSLHAAGVYSVQMFSIRREQGRLKELAPLVAHFVRTTPSAATWRPGLALTYCELGMREEARAEFEMLAADAFAGVPRDALWVSCLAYLAEICAYLGDASRAVELYGLLTPFDGHNLQAGSNIACLGTASRFLGLLAATMKRWPEAARHFEAALEINARQGALTWLAHTQHQYAEMLFARGRPEDRERAVGLLDAAIESAREIGMQALLERASALRETASLQPAPERYPAGLSPREVEVLRLVAAGKENREIARHLFVSPNTVANHVRSILTKTNTANRTEAAAFAVRNALLEQPAKRMPRA